MNLICLEVQRFQKLNQNMKVLIKKVFIIISIYNIKDENMIN
jgi:hypothetical protein